MSRFDLLPGNSTQLERDFSRSVSLIPKVEPHVPVVRTAKRRNYPASVLPWLIYEYGLGVLSEHFESYADLIQEGIAWQRVRGTPLAIELALTWLGYTATIDESEEAGTSWWSDYHLGFPGLVLAKDLRAICTLTRYSNPARTRTQRIFSPSVDYRRLVYSWPEGWSSGRRWGDHSGIRGLPGTGGTQVALAFLLTGYVNLPAKADGEHGLEIPGASGPSPIGDGHSSLGIHGFTDAQGEVDVAWLDEPWPDVRWRDTGASPYSSGVEFWPGGVAPGPSAHLEVTIPSDGFVFDLRTIAGVNYDVDWGDGEGEIGVTDNEKLHTYATAGVYVVRITPQPGSSFRLMSRDSATAEAITNFISSSLGFPWRDQWLRAFQDTSIRSFPYIDWGPGDEISSAIAICQDSGLTAFPPLDFSQCTDIGWAWSGNADLTDFPVMDFSSITRATAAWRDCALTPQSIENVLVSLDNSGVEGLGTHVGAGANADTSVWTPAANAAYLSLVAKGWTIDVNGTPPS
ncbi:MAG: phage tail protein [Cyanobacteria bacterium J06638_7]